MLLWKWSVSALSACAAFRKATWGMILETADSLQMLKNTMNDIEGGNTDEYALTLCLDAVLEI